MSTRVEWITLDAAFGAQHVEATEGRIADAFARGADWVGLEVGRSADLDALAALATGRDGVVVCGGSDALRAALSERGAIATRRPLDVTVAARALPEDALKRRLELLELPRSGRRLQ